MQYYFHLGVDEVNTAKKKQKKKVQKKKNRITQSVIPEIAADPELAKYWAQRYRLFSRFDEGIQLDRGKFITCIAFRWTCSMNGKTTLFWGDCDSC